MEKIVVDARMINSSGIGRYLKEIITRLRGEFDLTCLILEKDTSFFLDNSIKYKIFNAPIYSIKEQISFYKFSDKNAIFWSPHFNVPLFYFFSKKRIVTIHDAFHLAYYKQLTIAQKVYAKVFINFALKKSDKIITVSEFSKSEILKYTNKSYLKKIEVIHNGVSSEFNSNNKLESKTNKLYFLFVGNVKPHKNLKTAILAYNYLIKEYPELTKDIIFKIVGKKEGFITGDSELSIILNKYPSMKSRVEFTGEVSEAELINLYKSAYCFIFPSLYEGFGLPPLEAMACGCPTIVSNVASIPEICGDASIYFDPNKPQDLFKKMSEVIRSTDLQKELVLKGNEQIKKFTWAESAQKHIDLFKEKGK